MPTETTQTATTPPTVDKAPPTPTPNPPPTPPPDVPKPLPKSSPSSPSPKAPPSPKKERTPTPEPVVPDSKPDVDMETFQQILDLDEDTHEFSRGMAWAYFSQAEQTFKEMDKALLGKNLMQLSTLGHFLKGSSAALGLSKVQASCEKIQHYGQRRDEETDTNLTEKEALGKITVLLDQVNKEYAAAEVWLKKWYDDHPDADPVPEQP